MAETSWDFRVIWDMSGGIIFGFLLALHRGDQQINTTSPMTSPGMGRAIVGAAVGGTAADLDAVAGLAFPGWWANEIQGRGLSDQFRQAIKTLALAA